MNTDIGAIMSGVAALIIAFVEVQRLRKERKTTEKNEKPEARLSEGKFTKFNHHWILFFCVLLAFTSIGLVTIPRIISKPLVINLTYPQDGSSVSQENTIKGYTTREPDSEQRLYIVVEYGGLWWPQYSEVTIGYSHVTERYEFSIPARIGKTDDFGKEFTVRAIIVDSAIHQHFQSWFEQNVITEEWLGIPVTEANQWGNVQICASITVVRQ